MRLFVVDALLLRLALFLSSGLTFRRLRVRPLNAAPNHHGRRFGGDVWGLELDEITLMRATARLTATRSVA